MSKKEPNLLDKAIKHQIEEQRQRMGKEEKPSNNLFVKYIGFAMIASIIISLILTVINYLR